MKNLKLPKIIWDLGIKVWCICEDSKLEFSLLSIRNLLLVSFSDNLFELHKDFWPIWETLLLFDLHVSLVMYFLMEFIDGFFCVRV